MQMSFDQCAPTFGRATAPSSPDHSPQRMAVGDEEQASSVSWLDANDPIGAFMALHESRIEPGWRMLAMRTLIKLLAVEAGSPERRRSIAGMRVCSTETELSFFTTTVEDRPDAAVLGIFRKARTRSCTICKDCGCPARVRLIGEDESVTQCARCVAPRLLRHEIWELDQSLRFLKAVGRPISKSQIPQLLRSSFLQSVAVQPPDPEVVVKNGQMTIAQFTRWAEGWRLIGERLAVLH